MIKRAFQRPNCCFTTMLIAVAILTLIAGGLFAAIVRDAYQAEQAYREQKKAYEQHFQAWQDQGIQNYTVTYSFFCNWQFCCQDAQMEVSNGVSYTLDQSCSPGSSGYSYYYEELRAMDMIYRWLGSQLDSPNEDIKSIEYDPELHYIKRIVWEDWRGGQLEIVYENLTPHQ